MAEPLLNFHRLTGALPGITSAVPATCCIICPKFCAIGTSAGSVHILDLTGREWRRLQLHRSRITDLCTDEAGDWIGASADDGAVVVAAVHSDEVHNHGHHRPVRAVRIAPDYGRNRDRPLLSGGVAGKLRLLRRQWLLGTTIEKVVHEGEGPIRAIAWRGSLVAWANDAGVKVFDMATDERIGFIQADGSHAGQAVLEACPPRLAWVSDVKLLVAWGDLVRVVSIRERRVGLTRDQAEAAGFVAPAAPAVALPSLSLPIQLPLAGLGLGSGDKSANQSQTPAAGGDSSGLSDTAVDGPQAEPKDPKDKDGDPSLVYVKRRYGEVSHRIHLQDGYIAGVAPYGEHVALLCLEPPADASSLPRVDLRVVTPEGRELSRNVLKLKGLAPASNPVDIALASDVEGVCGADGLPVLYVMAGQDVVVASPRSVADHIEWAWAKGDLATAVDVDLASPGALSDARSMSLRTSYLEQLLSSEQHVAAAYACLRLLGGDAAKWEPWVDKFLGKEAREAVPGQAAHDGARAFLAVMPLPTGVVWPPAGQGRGQPSQPVARPRTALTPAAYSTAVGYLLRKEPTTGRGAVQAWRVKVANRGQADKGDKEGGMVNPAALLSRAAAAVVGSTKGALADDEPSPLPGHGPDSDGDMAGAGVVLMQEVATTGPQTRPIYDVTAVLEDVCGVIDALGQASPLPASSVQALHDVQAELYVVAGQAEEAVRASLKYLRTLTGEAAAAAAASVLSLIAAHSLYHLVAGEVTPLLDAGRDATLAMLVARVDAPTGALPMPGVLGQLRGRPRDQHAYLSAIAKGKWEFFNGQAGAPFHALFARLTAQYDRPSLLPFLQRTSHISLEDMRVLCEEGVEGGQAMQRELAWVLGRLGAAREALSLLLEGLGDVRGAVEFVAATEDEGLWAELVTRIVKSGSGPMAGQLLDSLPGTGLNAVKVLAALPASVPIPDLQVRLLKVLQDASLARRLTVICADLVRRDTFGLHARLVTRAGSGISVDTEARCGLCQGAACEPRAEYTGRQRGRARTSSAAGQSGAGEDVASQVSHGASESGPSPYSKREACVVAFWCSHVFHDTCIKSTTVTQAAQGTGKRPRAASAGAKDRGGVAEGGRKARAKSAAAPGRGKAGRPPRGSVTDSVDDEGRGGRSASSAGMDDEHAEELERHRGEVAADTYGRCPLCFSAQGPTAAGKAEAQGKSQAA